MDQSHVIIGNRYYAKESRHAVRVVGKYPAGVLIEALSKTNTPVGPRRKVNILQFLLRYQINRPRPRKVSSTMLNSSPVLQKRNVFSTYPEYLDPKQYQWIKTNMENTRKISATLMTARFFCVLIPIDKQYSYIVVSRHIRLDLYLARKLKNPVYTNIDPIVCP